MVLATIPARASRPDGTEPEDDTLVALGKVMASQARIERAWDAMKVEHHTYTSMVVQVSRALELMEAQLGTIEAQQKRRTRNVKWAAAMTPFALTALEFGKQIVLAWLASKGVR
jgi:hypothetical protein